LPMDVAGREVRKVCDDFHPRYDALSRCYRYRILCEPVRNPLRERLGGCGRTSRWILCPGQPPV
jgi:tRNA U38,U39,U40 pseudouridine synthase TruA